MYGKAVFFLRAERAVHLALDRGLTVGGTFLAVDPLEATALRILLSNVLPYVPAELLLPHLHLLGEVRSGVTPIPLGLRDATFRHIYSFRRQVFVRMAREECLEGDFDFPFQGATYRVFWSVDGVRCHACKEVGHVRKNCPASKATDPTTKAAGAGAVTSATSSSPTKTSTAPPRGEASPAAATTSAAGREEEVRVAGQKTRPNKETGAKNAKAPRTTKGKTAQKKPARGIIPSPPPLPLHHPGPWAPQRPVLSPAPCALRGFPSRGGVRGPEPGERKLIKGQRSRGW